MIASEQFDCLPIEEVGMMMGGQKMREYPPFNIQKGQLTKKKVKYANIEQQDLELRMECDKPEFCTMNHKVLKVPAAGEAFIRLRILVPNNIKEHYAEFTVTLFDNETSAIVEKQLYKLNLVE